MDILGEVTAPVDESSPWDIVSDVGLTALLVAAGRAIETHRPDALIADPHAETFVVAAHPARPIPVRPEQADETWRLLGDFMGIRTRYFDDAMGAGHTQVVILAAGLDARAQRLDWAPGTAVFELDVPAVLRFKADVLAAHAVTPRCALHPVGIDLRDDWPAALRAAGFRPGQPTAWVVEGLMPYLPAEAAVAVLTAVDQLSAPGSRAVVEYVIDVERLLADPEFRRVWDDLGVDIATLFQRDPRPDAGVWLGEHGWDTRIQTLDDVATGLGRDVDALGRRLYGTTGRVVLADR